MAEVPPALADAYHPIRDRRSPPVRPPRSVSDSVAALTTEMLRAVLLSQLKRTAVTLLAAACFAAGVGSLVGARPTPSLPENRPRPRGRQPQVETAHRRQETQKTQPCPRRRVDDGNRRHGPGPGR